MQSCIRPLDAGHKRPAGPDEICTSPPDQPTGFTSPEPTPGSGEVGL